mmetsp:Transcript_58763/g.110080  ORF Transcript_58763/g.110080 Transcript_58763/m.110080 type:complete len:322 (-) Transcript_58763:28-993(-)
MLTTFEASTDTRRPSPVAYQLDKDRSRPAASSVCLSLSSYHPLRLVRFTFTSLFSSSGPYICITSTKDFLASANSATDLRLASAASLPANDVLVVAALDLFARSCTEPPVVLEAGLEAAKLGLSSPSMYSFEECRWTTDLRAVAAKLARVDFPSSPGNGPQPGNDTLGLIGGGWFNASPVDGRGRAAAVAVKLDPVAALEAAISASTCWSMSAWASAMVFRIRDSSSAYCSIIRSRRCIQKKATIAKTINSAKNALAIQPVSSFCPLSVSLFEDLANNHGRVDTADDTDCVNVVFARFEAIKPRSAMIRPPSAGTQQDKLR